jgi:hypothetical protein
VTTIALATPFSYAQSVFWNIPSGSDCSTTGVIAHFGQALDNAETVLSIRERAVTHRAST